MHESNDNSNLTTVVLGDVQCVSSVRAKFRRLVIAVDEDVSRGWTDQI